MCSLLFADERIFRILKWISHDIQYHFKIFGDAMYVPCALSSLARYRRSLIDVHGARLNQVSGRWSWWGKSFSMRKPPKNEDKEGERYCSQRQLFTIKHQRSRHAFIKKVGHLPIALTISYRQWQQANTISPVRRSKNQKPLIRAQLAR